MKFCPKCGSIMMPKKSGSKSTMACMRCSYKEAGDDDTKISESMGPKKEIEVIENEVNPNPLVDMKCPECGHDKAHFWMVQTRAADEPATKFFRCEKCKKTWRDTD